MIKTVNETKKDPLQLYLSFYHHIIVVNCKEGEILERLKEEFHHFILPHPATPDSIINLNLAPPPKIPSLVASKILENGIVYHLGNLQYVDYFGEAQAVIDHEARTYLIYSESSDRLFELGFLTVHSRLGEELDLQGLARVHALGIHYKGINALIMLPSKGGKSTLLVELLKDPDIMVISDDMPMVDEKGGIHAFPSKISLDGPPVDGPLKDLYWRQFKRLHYPPKWTASLAQLSSRIKSDASQCPVLLMAGFRLSRGQGLIESVSRIKMVGPLLEHMIIGVGLPQIIELFLTFKFQDYIKLIRHAFMRSVSAFRLARRAETYHVFLGTDRSANAEMILGILREKAQN